MNVLPVENVTLGTYEVAAERYRAQLANPSAAVVAFIDEVGSHLSPGALALELGSGPGRDAMLLEQRGVQVRRTDGAQSFVDMMRHDGHDADLLDMRTDAFGGPYDLVFADASLLHLTVEQFGDVLGRAASAVGDGGLLAFTVKEGDGSAWTTDRLDLPRHFTYWREPVLREVLLRTGWDVLSLTRVQGVRDPWLYSVNRRSPG